MKLLKIAVAFVIALSAATGLAIEFKRAENFEDAFSASCRVSVANARGSGTFVYYDENNAYILTNYHVVTTNSTATVEFWTNSKLQRISGRVVWRYYDIRSAKPKDFAFIVVDAEQLKREVDPPFMPLAGPNIRPSEKSFICSAGAPDGRFVQAWKGQVVGYYNGETVEFQPPPVPGQSGSGIISFYDGELWLTAVLTWLFGEKGRDESTGGAIPIANLYDAAKNRPLPTSFESDSQTPSIPDNATECAAPPLRALIFTAPDCKACEKAKSEFDKVVKEVQSAYIDTSTSDGYTLSLSYAVTKIPTIVLIDDNDDAVCVVSPQEIAKGESVKKIDDFCAQFKTEFSKSETLSDSSSQDVVEPTIIEEPKAKSFRDRASVHERLPEEVGLIDDSESRWFSRRGKKQDEPAPKVEEKEEAPDNNIINDADTSSRLLSRLTNNIVNKVGEQIKASVKESVGQASNIIEEKLESKAREKYEEVEPIVKKTLWTFFFKGCALFIALTLFSLFIFGSVKKCFYWCRKKIIVWLATLKIPEEDNPS